MKLLSWISRMLVGALFIVSGLIKANDPTGFSYKLDEYFLVFGTPWMSSFSLFLAAFICVLEIVLGAAVIFGSKMKPVAWALLLLIVFFTFLTFYSAFFNKVTDCGCFGDALKLTPWESFWKDIALLFFTVIIFIDRKNIQPADFRTDMKNIVVTLALIAAFSFGVIHWDFPVWFAIIILLMTSVLKNRMHLKNEYIVILVSAFASIYFTVHCINHLPIKDFRPYAAGKNIQEGMTIPPGAPVDSVVMVFQYKKGAELFEFTPDNLPSDLDQYEFVDRIDKVVRKGYVPPIHDFAIVDQDGADHTETFLNYPGYAFMLVAYDLDKTCLEVQSKINEFVTACEKQQIPFWGMTSNSFEDVERFRHENQNMFQYYNCDATTLKTIIRSNPGLVMLKKGTVIDKWHCNDFPEFEEVMLAHPRN